MISLNKLLSLQKSRFLCKVMWMVFFCAPFVSMGQNDTIILKNNDRIVGEIKQMVNGVLTMEPEYSDQDFKITWLEVISIRSLQYYLISTEDGDRINSSLQTQKGDSSKVTLYTFAGNKTVNIDEIVYIKAIKESFISRLDASLSLGFNFTKSNNLSQLTLRSIVNYTGRTWGLNSSFNTIQSSQDDIEDTRRTDANIGGQYFLDNDWFLALNADFLANEEQQLRLRVATRLLLGKYIIHSNRVYLATAAGLAWNNESFNDELNTNRNSLEAVLGLQLDIFDIDDLNLFSSLFFYPSLTQGDRYRIDFRTDLKYDLPFDFFIKVGYTLNYDSQPIGDAAESDYVLQATFGWELD